MTRDTYNHTEVLTLSLGALDTNCYIVSDLKTRQCLIIDPADEGGTITQVILDEQLTPTAIVLTHGHFDHVLGLLEVKLNFDVPILMHEKDAFLLKRAQSSALHWLKLQVDPVPPADRYVNDSTVITCGELVFTVQETPGHTPGGIVLYNDEVMFTGDTIFKDGVGRTDFAYSSLPLLQRSLATIKNTDQGQVKYAGHGGSWK